MESNARYFRRRAAEEYAASQRSVTPEGKMRRMDLAQRFLAHLDEDERHETLVEWGIAKARSKPASARTKAELEEPALH